MDTDPFSRSSREGAGADLIAHAGGGRSARRAAAPPPMRGPFSNGTRDQCFGANLEHGDIVLDREGDHSMPTLRNSRHERFAQALATGKTADAAYVLAGYKENRSNAARLGADRDIQARVAEIQSVGAERAAITVESLMSRLSKQGVRR